MKILSVDEAWMALAADAVTRAGGHVAGLVVFHRGNKVLIGANPDGTFQATAEYEGVRETMRTVNRKGATCLEALNKCCDALQRLGVQVV